MVFNGRLLCFCACFLAVTAAAQDDDMPSSSFERSRSFYFELKAGACQGGHKQAEYYNGTHSRFRFDQLYSIPQVRNDINASVGGYNTFLGEYPPVMRYQWSGQISGSVLYYFNPSTAVFLRFTGSRNTSSGVFTLVAADPANPSGNDLVFNQQMRGLELRTWYLPGIRFESEPFERGEINPFFELALVGGGIKPIRNEAIVEGKKYNLFTYDPNFATDTRLKPGYGLFASFGLISWVKPANAVEISADITWVRLRILPTAPNAFYWSITAGFVL